MQFAVSGRGRTSPDFKQQMHLFRLQLEASRLRVGFFAYICVWELFYLQFQLFYLQAELFAQFRSFFLLAMGSGSSKHLEGRKQKATVR